MSERLNSFDQIQPPIRIAFFDLGGVVFSFHGGLEAMAQLFNKPLSQVKEYYFSRDDQRCRGELAPQQFWNDLVSQFGSGDRDMDFLQFWTSYFRPVPETHQAMQDVQSRGVALGILTNMSPGVFDIALRLGVIPTLDYAVVVQSCDLGIVKPDPAIFNHALRLAGVSPEQAVLIDDRAENTNAVEALGWYSLPFPPTRN